MQTMKLKINKNENKTNKKTLTKQNTQINSNISFVKNSKY